MQKQTSSASAYKLLKVTTLLLGISATQGKRLQQRLIQVDQDINTIPKLEVKDPLFGIGAPVSNPAPVSAVKVANVTSAPIPTVSVAAPAPIAIPATIASSVAPAAPSSTVSSSSPLKEIKIENPEVKAPAPNKTLDEEDDLNIGVKPSHQEDTDDLDVRSLPKEDFKDIGHDGDDGDDEDSKNHDEGDDMGGSLENNNIAAASSSVNRLTKFINMKRGGD